MLKRLLIVATFACVAVAPVQAEEVVAAEQTAQTEANTLADTLTPAEQEIVAALIAVSQEGSAAQQASVKEQFEQLMTDNSKRVKCIRWGIVGTVVALATGVTAWVFWPEIKGFGCSTYERFFGNDDAGDTESAGSHVDLSGADDSEDQTNTSAGLAAGSIPTGLPVETL